MAHIVIAKNNTGSSISIEDMGVEIPGSGQRTLSDTFDFNEICTSEDLKGYITNSTFTINDGSSDLSIDDALDHVDCQLPGGEGTGGDGTTFIPHNLSDHIDVSGVSPDDTFTLKYNQSTGLWGPAEDVVSNNDTPPDSTATVWIAPDDRMPYFWDPELMEWLSIDRTVFSFGRAGKTDGSYLQSSGVTRSGYYYIHRPAKMTHVYYRAQKGKQDKAIEIHVNQSNVYGFSLSNFLYVSDINIDVSPGDELQIRVSSAGGNIQDSVCQIEVAWRYE